MSKVALRDKLEPDVDSSIIPVKACGQKSRKAQ
jgi:hypothetical protein